MIYKFHFEVCTDDNKTITANGQESGKFWVAFAHFCHHVMAYAIHYGIVRDE